MKIITTYPDTNTYPVQMLSLLSCGDLFFDIETTGLSKTHHSIYLIGCMYLEDNKLVIKQYFAEDITDEKELLEQFTSFASAYARLLSFNGDTFDLPFISEKLSCYSLADPFNEKETIDLYKIAKNYQHILKTENLKQKSIEHALGCYRNDKYSGGELIQTYHDYVRTKNSQLFDLLMLHNYDDMLGMTYLLSLLSFHNVFRSLKNMNVEVISQMNYEKIYELQLIISSDTPLALATTLSYSVDDYYITFSSAGFRLAVGLTGNCAKVPYANYKDYVYLPLEDMAIPKVLSGGIPKTDMAKCTMENCYGWLEMNHHFLNNPEAIRSYTEKVLTYIFTCKKKTPKK